MPERTVRLGSMFYIDADGRGKWGDCGDVVQVHADNVERFDRLNVLPGTAVGVEAPDSGVPEGDTSDPEPPKRRPGRPRKDAGD